MSAGVFFSVFGCMCVHNPEQSNPDNQLRHEAAAICSCTYNNLFTLFAEVVDHCLKLLQRTANPSPFFQASQIRLCKTAGVQQFEL